MLPFRGTHRKRLKSLLLIVGIPVLGIGLFISAIKDNLHLYLTPSDIVNTDLSKIPKKNFRVGGLVKTNTLIRDREQVSFELTDQGEQSIKVLYKGSLPSLFQEGQGAVIEGLWVDNHFKASKVLVKHDENYSPPKVLS